MGEFITNFQKKHGQKVPMPKIYRDEDTSDTTVLSWQMGPEQPRRPQVVQEAPAGANHVRSLQLAVAVVKREEQAVVTAPAQAVAAQVGLEEESGVEMMTVMMMTPTSVERPAKVHQSQWWPAKSHARRPQVTLRLTGSCHPSTSLAQKREPSWVTAYWIEPMSRRGRSMRHECKGGW